MGKFLNHINKNNVIEIDALASLLGGKGKKYIMKMYGFTPEQADEVIKAKQTITDISAELAKKEASEIVLPKNYLESLLVKFFGIDPEKEEIYFEKHEDGIKVEHRPIGGKRIHLDHEKVIEEVKADGGHTDAEIAKKYGVTRGAIYYIRKQNGICKSRKLNDDIIKNITEDLKNGIPVSEIVNNYAISKSSVYNLRKKMQADAVKTPEATVKTTVKSKPIDNTPPAVVKKSDLKPEIKAETKPGPEIKPETKPIPTVAVEPVPVKEVGPIRISDVYEAHKFSQNDFNKINNIQTFECALTERHDMPVKNSIFGRSVSPELMFDFELQKDIAKNYIKNNLSFNKDGSCSSKLVLYTSGLQCILSSTIAACAEMKIPLSVMHYNSKTNEYEEQEIFKTDKSEIPTCISDLYPDAEYKIYKGNTSVFNAPYVYLVSNIVYKQMTTQTQENEIYSTVVSIFADKNTAIEFYKFEKGKFDNDVFFNYAGMHKQHLIFERISIKSGIESEIVDSTNY
jgi:uncharacterized protein (DUF433 family)